MIRKILISFLLVSPTLVLGHHSTSEYETTVVTEIQGEVVKVFWRNPHVIIHVASGEKNKRTLWKLEGSSVSAQRRRGMTQDMIAIGDQVRAAGSASTRREGHMLLDNLLLPDGQELMMRSNGKARWPDSKLRTFKTGVDATAKADAKANGIFRVWTWGRLSRGWWFFGPTENFALTETALAKAAEWDEYTDNPQLDCTAPGMPATMGNPYPMQFVKVGENIEIHLEEFDVVRTIHMNGNPDASVAPAALGYSMGRWQDETTLVITTDRINWPYFNRVGVPQSEDVEVWERFVLDDGSGQLAYTIRVTDPATLLEPYEYDALWKWVPGEVVSRYDCSTEDE